MLDLIVKGGKIVDGSGLPAFTGDIGIKDGKIVRVGSVTEDADRTVDASGKVVTPGFIDPHTHFDAQLLWDGAAKPAIEHGVTTIVPGNCSLSLAPLKAEHRMRLVGMFNQIEEMPHIAFEKGKNLVAEAQAMMPLWEMLVLRQVASEENQQYVGKTLKEIAAARGTDALNVMIDLSLEEELDAHFLAGNMGHNDDAKVGSLLSDPNVMIGASDGGAHILSFSTYGDTGYLFSRFVRDQKMIGLEAAVKKITADTAGIWGIADRGLIRTGYAADLTIFDEGLIDRGPEYYVQDVPGDGHRYVRDSIGVESVVIGGELAWTSADGYTNAHRGQVLGGRA